MGRPGPSVLCRPKYEPTTKRKKKKSRGKINLTEDPILLLCWFSLPNRLFITMAQRHPYILRIQSPTGGTKK